MAENTLYLDWVCDVLNMEAEDLHEITAALDHDFIRVAEALLYCKGRVVTTGMGKPRHAGRKMATIVASTGMPALFIHPVEAAHGDLGMIVNHDVVTAISGPGESDEIAATIPALKRKNITLICITAHPTSTMARHADIHITAAASKEACPFGLVPTSSTTVVMALGDALAVTSSRARAFAPDGFTLSHPVDSLGKRLLLCVADIMYKDETPSTVLLGTPLKEAIVRMGEKGLDMLVVIDAEDHLKGVLADGDLRRLFRERDSFTGLRADDITHASPKTISVDHLAIEASKVVRNGHVNGLLVVEKNGVLIDALNMHDLLMARVV